MEQRLPNGKGTGKTSCLQKIGLASILISIFFVRAIPAQFIADDQPRYPVSSRSIHGTQDKNTLRHGPSRLNSSVSFGISESEIAAIFRGVAYGVTSQSAKSKSEPRNKTTTTTSTTTTSTTTPSTTTSTTTTTTTTTLSPISNNVADDESWKPADLPNLNHNAFPNDDWNSNPYHDRSSIYHSAEKVNEPTHVGRGNLYDFRDNVLDEINAQDHFKSGESSYLQSRASNYPSDSKPAEKANIEDVEIHQVVDYAWMIHVYLTGVLMGVVAAMAIGCIPRIHFCSPVFPRNFFVTMHVLVFLAALLRCILLFHGSFGEANSKMPKVLTGLLINSVPPCLTAAFALVLLVYLKATHLYILPMKYQSSFVLAVICVLHIVVSVIVDICAGLSDSESIISALRAAVQSITAGWGVLLCLAFIYLIINLRNNEEMRAVVPRKSLHAMYVSVAVQFVLSCFLVYGIISPPQAKTKTNDNTWSVWVSASIERLLEACFCVTLVVITTTFTMNKCDNSKPQEQKVFSVMTNSKREGGLGRSANVYPVTTDKGGFLANGLLNGGLDADGAAKSENYYAGWLDKYNTGTINSVTSDFQLLGKGTSTMSTVLYPPFGNMIGEGGEEAAANGQESSTTSYSTLSSYRPVTGGHMCYCNPVAQCCNQSQKNSNFPCIAKQSVLLVSQYSHPQGGNSLPPSEESTSGSSYYGSSLGSSHIYSSPQYYTCPNQLGNVAEVHEPARPVAMHMHQCSEVNNIQQTRVPGADDSRHIPSASLPILQDIPQNNKRLLQCRPQQPLPQSDQMSNDNNTQLAGHPALAHHRHHLHPSQQHPQIMHVHHHPHIHPATRNCSPQQQQQQHPSSNHSLANNHNSTVGVKVPENTTINQQQHSHKIFSSKGGESSSSAKNSVKGCITSSSAQREGRIESSDAIETIEGSDCSFLNKLVKSPEGQILSSSLELDVKRTSQRKKGPIVDQSTGLPAMTYRQHMALDDVDLPSQIV